MLQPPEIFPAESSAVNGVVTLHTPRAELWTITPAQARALLERAHRNRPVGRARVKTIARAIAAGRWAVNGETLVLCPERRVLDGRHRLLAVVEADRAIETFVVVGISADTFPTMDQGAKRSAGDVLATFGHPQAQALASATRWTWRYEYDAMRSAAVALLDYELPDYLAQHPTLPKSLEWGKSVHALLPQGLGAALHYLMSGQDPALAKQFFYALGQGQNLTGADPIWHVREGLLRAKGPLYHANIVERAALVVQAWNCVRQKMPWVPGRAWRGLSDKSVPFPDIV